MDTQISHGVKTILFIDDDQGILDMYKLYFSVSPRKEVYRFLSAPTIDKGKELATTANPHIILLDLVLQKILVPQSDEDIKKEELSKEYGFNLLQELKGNPATQATPIIIISNLSSLQDKDRAKQLGANQYLVKSDVVPSQVLEEIKKYVT